MDDVTRLLSLVAEPPGPSAPPPAAPLLRRARRRARSRSTAAVIGAVVAVLAISLPLAFLTQTEPRPGPVANNPMVPVTTEGTVEALGTARWSSLPDAPIPGRSRAASVWTGSELLVWGGVREDRDVRSDGVAYDPDTRRWRTLPSSPLAAVTDARSAWTGAGWLVLGGESGGGEWRQQFASFDPLAQRWSSLALPDGLILARESTAAWTGRELVVVGFGTASGRPGDAAAAYDPESSQWRRLPDVPRAPDHEEVLGRTSVADRGGVVVLTGWRTTMQIDANSSSGRAGVEVSRYEASGERWTQLEGADSPTGIADPVSTPSGVLVPAADFVRVRGGPSPSGLAGWLLEDGAWSRLPQGPVDDLLGPSVWTGSALITADTATFIDAGETKTLPGAAAAYDPATRTWTRLAAAPAYTEGGALVWTGRELLLWGELYPAESANSGKPVRPESGGLALTPTSVPSAKSETTSAQPCPTTTGAHPALRQRSSRCHAIRLDRHRT